MTLSCSLGSCECAFNTFRSCVPPADPSAAVGLLVDRELEQKSVTPWQRWGCLWMGGLEQK